MASVEPMIRRRRLLIAAWVAVAAAFAPGILRLRIDDAPERFFVHDAEALERYRDLELRFGRDRGVLLVLPGEAVWSREGLARLGRLEEAAQDRSRVGGGVYGAAGLYGHHRWHLDGWPPADPERFRRRVTGDALDPEAGWVSRDGRYAAVLVGLFEMPAARREATLDALEALLPEGGFAVGVPLVDRALDAAVRALLRRSLPLLLGLATVVLFAVFRSRAALLPLALAAVSETVLLGAMGYAGGRLDVVTSVLPPLVFVVAVATGVHVLAFHRRLTTGGAEPREAVAETYRIKAWPVFWTGATTCAGFASLAVSPVPPVRWLGLWAAFGIAYLTLAALTFYPALLAVAGGRATGSAVPWLARAGGRLAAFAVRRRRAVLLAFAGVAVVAGGGILRLAVETGVLTYLAPGHPVRERISALEAAGVGAVTASLVIERPDGPGLDDAGSARKLAALAATLRAEPQVLGAVSSFDLAASIAGDEPAAAGLAADAPEAFAAARRRIATTPELARLLAHVETGDGRRSRILLATRMVGHRELDPVYRRARDLAAQAFPDAEVAVTGRYPLVLAAQRSMLRTMLASLSLTLLAVAATLWGILRSGALAWRALLPNLWPVLVVLGAMGWSGVPVDSTTVMVAAVVLALAVDDTLHTLGHFREAVRAAPAGRAAVATMREAAAGHLTTSCVLALGFAACGLSPLVPVARFGALAVVGVTGALLADLLLVPALLASVRVANARD